MTAISAGILLYRHVGGKVEVLLIHPGGPFWARKDEGAWSIPKGLVEPGEDRMAAARREFAEETGGAAEGPALDLGAFQQPGGKVIRAFAVEGDFEAAFPPEQPLRHGMATPVGQAADLPRGRPGQLVHPGSSPGKAHKRADSLDWRAAGAPLGSPAR